MRRACCSLGAEVLGVDDVPEEMVELVAEDGMGEWPQMKMIDGHCVAPTPDGECGIYARRPTVCRQFTPGCIRYWSARETIERLTKERLTETKEEP